MHSLYYEGRNLSPRGRVLWEVENNIKGIGMMEARSNLHDDVCRRAKAALREGEARRASVRSLDELKEYQSFVRDSFLDSIGGLPSFDTPLNARTVRSQEVNGFILENVIYESRPHSYVTCNLYRPLHQDGPVPGVFVPLGHTDEGKGFDEYQRVAQMLVYAGFIVLTMDPIGQGERFEHFEKEIDFQPIQGCSGEHDLLDWKCKLTGESLVRYFIHDGMRGIEYLKSRPECSGKVAVTGHSGGGTQTSVLMTAASHLLDAAAPCSYTTDKQAMYECGKDPDNEMIWPGVVAKGIDYADIMAGMAPKPVLILCNRYDFFPWEGTDRTFKRITSLWQQVGSTTLPELKRVATGHAFSVELAETVTRFFARHLMGRENIDLSGFRYQRQEPSVLNCTASGQIVKEFPDLVTTQDLLSQKAAALKAARLAKPYEKRLADTVAWLTKSVMNGRVPCEPHVRVDDEGVMAHYIIRRLAWRYQEGYTGNGMLLRDLRHDEKPLPTVIALWENGTNDLERHSNWIHRQCASGRQVLIVDVAGVGTLAPNPISNANMNIGWCTHYILQSNLIDLDDCYAALRSYQLMQALAVAPDLPLPCSDENYFYGEGEFARCAKVAGLLSGTKVLDNQAYQQYGEIVTEKYPDQTHTHDWAWPGILAVTDMDELDEYLLDQKLLQTKTEGI